MSISSEIMRSSKGLRILGYQTIRMGINTTSETAQGAAQYFLRDKSTGRFFDGEMFYGEVADAVPLTEPEVDCLLYDFQREFIEMIAA